MDAPMPVKHVGPALEGSLSGLFQKQQVRSKQREMKENWPDGRGGRVAFLTEGIAYLRAQGPEGL